MFYIPNGTIIKDAEELKGYKTRRNSFPEVRLSYTNGTPMFDIDFEDVGYQSYEHITFSVEAEKVPDGFKVIKVRKITW